MEDGDGGPMEWKMAQIGAKICGARKEEIWQGSVVCHFLISRLGVIFCYVVTLVLNDSNKVELNITIQKKLVLWSFIIEKNTSTLDKRGTWTLNDGN